jgi:hypothetical protein
VKGGRPQIAKWIDKGFVLGGDRAICVDADDSNLDNAIVGVGEQARRLEIDNGEVSLFQAESIVRLARASLMAQPQHQPRVATSNTISRGRAAGDAAFSV